MPILNDTARATIEGGHLGHLVTLNPDGSPQMSAVLVGLENDEIVAATLVSTRRSGTFAAIPE